MRALVFALLAVTLFCGVCAGAQLQAPAVPAQGGEVLFITIGNVPDMTPARSIVVQARMQQIDGYIGSMRSFLSVAHSL